MTAPIDGMAIYEAWIVQFASQANARLAQIAAGGFQLVLNYDSFMGSSTDVLNYANYAQSVGLKLIWALHDPLIWLNNQTGSSNALYNTYTALCTSAGLTNMTANDQTFVTYAVNLVKSHPATWGYYIGDEVDPSNHAALLSHSNYVEAADANHPRIFILGASNRTTSFGSGNSIFSDVSEVIGDDYYPNGYTLLPWLSPEEESSGIQLYTNSHHLQSAAVLQSTSWQRYPSPTPSIDYPYDAPWPSALDMRLKRDTFLKNMQPRVLLWYSYFDLALSSNPGKYWNDLCYAANNVGSPSTQQMIAQDIFDRSNQSGWGNAQPDGDVWTHPLGGLTSSVSSNSGVLTGATNANIFLLGTGTLPNPTIIMRFVLSNINTGTAGLILRYVDSNNYIAVKITNNLLQVVKVVAGTPTVLGSTTTNVSLSSGGGYYLKIDSSSTGYSLKLWNAQVGAEPSSSYTLTCSDSAGAIGRYGIFAQLGSSGDTLTVYSFAVFAVTNTYYLSPTGSDTNPGTQTQPCLTFGHMQSIVLPGDTVYVLPGTYSRTTGNLFLFSTSGTPFAHIQYISTVHGQALLRTTNNAIIIEITASCVDLVGLDISSVTTTTNTGILCTGSLCAIKNCIIHDIQSIGSGGQAIVSEISPATHNYVTGCLIKNIGTSSDPSSASVYGILWTRGTGFIINNIIINVTGVGIECSNASSSPTMSLTISNNLIAQCFYGGLIVWGSTGLVDNFLVNNNIFAYCTGPRYAIFEAGTTGSNSRYKNNLLWQNATSGGSAVILLNGIASGTITANPQFINYQPDGSGNYRTTNTSSCIDAGDTSTWFVALADINGTLRTIKPTADIGPYLFVSQALFPNVTRRTGIFPALQRRQSNG